MNRRIENLEFREGPINGGEIVCWDTTAGGGDFWFTIAVWQFGHDNIDLLLIGSRPFDEDRVDRDVFWALAEYGQKVIEAAQELASRTRD